MATKIQVFNWFLVGVELVKDVVCIFWKVILVVMMLSEYTIDP